MNPFKGLKNLLLKADFFYTTQLLRYNEESDFRTLTGGICSMAIVSVIAILFINLTISTFNRSNVFFSVSANRFNDPPPLQMNVDNKTFMFGVELIGVDLNQGDRYFDVVSYQEITTKNQTTGERENFLFQIKLQQCTPEHWGINEEIKSDYILMDMSKWQCPPLDTVHTITGKYASANWSLLSVYVLTCTNESNPSRPCLPAENISEFIDNEGSMYYTLFFVNPLINPSDKNYLSYYLEDNNYIQFSNQMSNEAFLSVSQYEIDTDESLLPYTTNKQETGAIVQGNAVQYPSYHTTNQYAAFFIVRSSRTITYQRSFQKFDYVFSYVGGLFGAIIGIMFLMKAYTGMSFEIALGSQMFSTNEGEDIKFKDFNIFKYFGYILYKGFSFLGAKCDWKGMEIYENCRYEIQKQLDIRFFIERISFLERGLQMLCDEHQFKGLHLQKKITLNQAKKARQNYYIKTALKIKSRTTIKKDNQSQMVSKMNQSIFANQKTSQIDAKSIKSVKSSKFKPHKSIKNIKPQFQIFSQSDQIERSQNADQSTKCVFISAKKQIKTQLKKDKMIEKQSLLIQEVQSQQVVSQKESGSESISMSNHSLDLDLEENLKRLKESARLGDTLSINILKNLDKKVLEELKAAQSEQIQDIQLVQNSQEPSASEFITHKKVFFDKNLIR